MLHKHLIHPVKSRFTPSFTHHQHVCSIAPSPDPNREHYITKHHITGSPLDHSLHVHEAYHSFFSFYLSRDWPARDQVTRVVSMLMSPLLPKYKPHFPACEPGASSCSEALYRVHPGSASHRQHNIELERLEEQYPNSTPEATKYVALQSTASFLFTTFFNILNHICIQKVSKATIAKPT
jgi:hypothetical protein